MLETISTTQQWSQSYSPTNKNMRFLFSMCFFCSDITIPTVNLPNISKNHQFPPWNFDHVVPPYRRLQLQGASPWNCWPTAAEKYGWPPPPLGNITLHPRAPRGAEWAQRCDRPRVRPSTWKASSVVRCWSFCGYVFEKLAHGENSRYR